MVHFLPCSLVPRVTSAASSEHRACFLRTKWLLAKEHALETHPCVLSQWEGSCKSHKEWAHGEAHSHQPCPWVAYSKFCRPTLIPVAKLRLLYYVPRNLWEPSDWLRGGQIVEWPCPNGATLHVQLMAPLIQEVAPLIQEVAPLIQEVAPLTDQGILYLGHILAIHSLEKWTSRSVSAATSCMSGERNGATSNKKSRIYGTFDRSVSYK